MTDWFYTNHLAYFTAALKRWSETPQTRWKYTIEPSDEEFNARKVTVRMMPLPHKKFYRALGQRFLYLGTHPWENIAMQASSTAHEVQPEAVAI